MNGQIFEQLGVSLVCIIVGLMFLEQLPTHRRTRFSVRGFPLSLLGPLLPDTVNRAVPKVIGTILLIAGLVILTGTVIIGSIG